MSVYLHDIPLNEARARLEQALKKAGRDCLLGVEELRLDEHCVGRVLAEPVWAKISSPHYHASAMDGFALCAAATSRAMIVSPARHSANRAIIGHAVAARRSAHELCTSVY